MHDVLVFHPRGSATSRNGPRSRPAGCWNRVSGLAITWPRPFLDCLISNEERHDGVRAARREQRRFNSVEAQIAVVNAGPAFWAAALAWGKEQGLLTPAEVGILGVAARPAGKTPTERQVSRAIEALSKLQLEGYAGELSSGA